MDGENHSIRYGTFRNKLSALQRPQKIQVAYHSSQTFYTIKGFTFDKQTIKLKSRKMRGKEQGINISKSKLVIRTADSASQNIKS